MFVDASLPDNADKNLDKNINLDVLLDDEDDFDTGVDDNVTINSEKTQLSTQSQPIIKNLSCVFTPKSSCFFTESQPSVVTNVSSINM